MVENKSLRVAEITRDRYARTAEARIGKKRVMIPSMNITIKSAKDFETFVYLKTDQQTTQVNMMTVRGYHSGMLLRAKQTVREEEGKSQTTKWIGAVKSVFDNTVTLIDPASEFTYYESLRAWELMRHSVDVPLVIRNH